MVNEQYYGTPETWVDRPSMNDVPFSVPCYHTAGTATYEGLQGAFGIKWAFDENKRNVKTDTTFCYIGMDNKHPFKPVYMGDSKITGDTTTQNIWDTKITKTTPFGWCMWNNGGTGAQNSPLRYWEYANNFYSWVINPIGDFVPDAIPQSAVIDSQFVRMYHGYYTQPVLSFPYKKIALVPILKCKHLNPAYTTEDLDNAANTTAFNNMAGTDAWFDLHTYMTGQCRRGGVVYPIYEYWDIITKIVLVPIELTFDSETHELTSIKNVDAGTAYPSWSNFPAKSLFNPCWIPERQYPDYVFYGTDGVNHAGEFSADYSFQPTYRVGANTYKSFIVSGTSEVTSTWAIGTYAGFGVMLQLEDSLLSNSYLAPSHIPYQGENAATIYHNNRFPTGMYWVYAYTHTEANATAMENEIMRICAYFGMYFFRGFDILNEGITNEMTQASVYMGVVDGQGVTHGEYTHGADNADNLNYDWDDPLHDTPFSPGTPPAPEDELPSDPYTPYPQPSTGFNIAMSHYALHEGDLKDLFDWIYWYSNYDNALAAAQAAGTLVDFVAKYPDTAAWVSHVCERAGYNVFPTNNMVSLLAFPFELSGVDSGYQLGDWNTANTYENFDLIPDTPTLTGKKVTGEGYQLIDLGSFDVAGMYGDFRDFAPYCKIDLNIPYHGTVELPPSDFIGHTVSVSAIVELVSGSSLGIVFRDSAPYATITGQMGMLVPLTADNVGATTNTLLSMSYGFHSSNIGAAANLADSAINIVQGATGLLIGDDVQNKIASGFAIAKTLPSTAAGLAQRYIGIKQELHQMHHLAEGKSVLQTGSPLTGFAYEYRCRITYHYPKTLVNSGNTEFANVAGYACNKTGRIGDFSGFTQFSSVDLSGITCTSEMKSLIVSMLQSGIYI